MTAIKQKEKKQKSSQFKLVNLFLILGVLFLGAYYLVGVNDLSIKTYMLQDEKRKAAKIRNERNELELKVMAKSSFNSISGKLETLKMVKVDKIEYINSAPAVALSK